MKKILLTICLILLGFIIGIPASYAGYCLTTTETDNADEGGSLRHKIEVTYNTAGEFSTCTPPSNSGDLDHFEQVVIFATSEAGYSNNIEEITLRSEMIFNNSSLTISIGNWTPNAVSESDLDVTYSQDYIDAINAAGDYGLVVIDGNTNFEEEVLPIKCASGTSEVYFRNVAIHTNGVSEEELFDADNPDTACFRDAGAVYVCDGELDATIEPGQNGWCVSEDVIVDPNDIDDDGDGLSENEGDCDDTDPNNYPGNTERCDGQDNDCDNLVDDNDPDVVNQSTYYIDADGDGYGDAASTIDDCEQPSGYVEDNTDCDDGDGAVNPNAEEICDDGIDNNCDGSIDPESSCTPSGSDDDGDGYIDENDGGDDCDDNDAAVNPGASESSDEECDDGVDNDCDGNADSADSGCGDDSDVDDDGDGYTENEGDCDDDDSSVNPGAAEICDSGVDNDCDGEIDEVCSGETDADDDGDGYSEEGGDCDDTNAAISPDAIEECDSVDNNCDGEVDETCVGDLSVDDDGDGYCEDDDVCTDGSIPGDCDDANAEIYPSADEICDDGSDNNCDGVLGSASSGSTSISISTLAKMKAVIIHFNPGNENTDDGDITTPDDHDITRPDDRDITGGPYWGDFSADPGESKEEDDVEDLEAECLVNPDEPDEDTGGGCALITASHGQNANQIVLMLLGLFPLMVVGSFRFTNRAVK